MVLQTLTLTPLTALLDSAVVRDIEVAPGETLRTTTREQRELLRERPENFAADSVPGSGQYIHEEQPAAVVAVARLHQAAGK